MKYQKILRQVAKENHTTPEEVEREMQRAIDAAYENPDAETRALQQQIPCRGSRPTPEEFIFGIAAMI